MRRIELVAGGEGISGIVLGAGKGSIGNEELFSFPTNAPYNSAGFQSFQDTHILYAYC